MKTVFDVVIVGGGPAGAVTALRLAQAGRSVLLIDRARSLQRKVGESLPGSARPLLRHLGLLKVVENGPHLISYGNVSYWGSEEIQQHDFIRDPNGLGWHLDRSRFDEDLRTAAREAGADFLNTTVEDFTATDFGWRLRAGRQSFDAKWIVDATGRVALIARQLGAIRKKDDNMMALYAFAQPKQGDLDTRTLIESTKQGWWYTAQLPDMARVVAFHSESTHIGEMMRSPVGWQNQLGKTVHIQKAIRQAPLITEVRCTEATGARLDQFAGRNWIATGDAALSFDPLSSQGIFNSLYTGMKAADAVHQSLGGESSAIGEYIVSLERIRSAYLNHRLLYYSVEQRWTNQPFWKQRAFAQARS